MHAYTPLFRSHRQGVQWPPLRGRLPETNREDCPQAHHARRSGHDHTDHHARPPQVRLSLLLPRISLHLADNGSFCTLL